MQVPWWMMLFSILILPILQPLTDYGASKVQEALKSKPAVVQQQQAVPQPYIVFHNGEWWKFENGQWFVWRKNS